MQADSSLRARPFMLQGSNDLRGADAMDGYRGFVERDGGRYGRCIALQAPSPTPPELLPALGPSPRTP
jgi:hypothetical protein